MLNYKELKLKFDKFIDSITQEEIDVWLSKDEDKIRRHLISQDTGEVQGLGMEKNPNGTITYYGFFNRFPYKAVNLTKQQFDQYLPYMNYGPEVDERLGTTHYSHLKKVRTL